MIREQLEQAGAPGATIAVLVDGEPLLVDGEGYGDLDRTVPLPADAACYIYSISKTVIAALVLQLVEQGRVVLDAPLQRYLPLPALYAPVTIRQLLEHTAGLPDYGALDSYNADLRADPGRPWTASEYLEHTLPLGLRFVPGEGWGYSNIGYLLLKLLLEQQTGHSFAALVDERVVAPLGLRYTLVAESLADARRLTPAFSAYFRDDGGLEDVAPRYHPGWVSHGVLISTAAELARIVDAIFDGRLVQPSSLSRMLAGVPVGGEHHLFRRPCYGLGLMIDPVSDFGTVAGHGGGGPGSGYSTGALCAPDLGGRRVVAVALANRDVPDLGLELAFRLLRSTLDRSAAPPCDV